MPSGSYYQSQAELFLRMALACSEPVRAAQLQAQARIFLNLASQMQDGSADLNALLEEFNHQQLLVPAVHRSTKISRSDDGWRRRRIGADPLSPARTYPFVGHVKERPAERPDRAATWECDGSTLRRGAIARSAVSHGQDSSHA